VTDRLLRPLRTIAIRIPELVGSPWAFLVALVLTAAWIVWGVFQPFADTWLLVPSALASVVTFLIVFSLQYTQNRDTRAIQLKLDEILRATSAARNELVKLEHFSDEELTRIEDEIVRQRDEAAGSA
jgi:low affinity Fe/Cu permease